ncbi:uncharacterized protein LOC134274124 [Saccostrea cucullata]|uniref:uncharacterized protein LOC134274124 n=1 Tax=Saccostrea cuccullata TaxID=36930 RepID=UPI002ED0729D
MVSEDNKNISENSSTTKIFLKFSEMANDSTETEDTVMTRSLVPGSKELSHGHITKDEDSGKILQLISEQLQMMCISLFLILGCLIILPLVLWYNIRKRTRKPDIHIGMKQSDTSAMNNRQSLAMMMERRYTIC